MLTLRALRARWAQSLALFAMGILAVAGCIVAVGYSRAAHVSVGSAGALLLLCIVAIAAQGAASVRTRRYEIALAQLRGRHGPRLLSTAVREPAVILLAATAAGIAIGRVATRVAVHRWVGERAAFEMTGVEWTTAAVVLLVSVVVVGVAGWRTIYEPLTAKLDDLDRPRPATAAGLFITLVVLLGAVVSVYQARQLGTRNADWVSFLSPALVGLAAGQIGIWLVTLLSRQATGSTRLNKRLTWFLTLRRLTRRADSVAVIRIVVAAAVVAGVAGSAWVGSGAWRAQTARLETGGPIAFAVPAGALRAYVASHKTDPEGRWLMAMSAAPERSGGSYRDLFIDAPRWNAVVGSFFADTPVAGVSSQISAISTARTVRPARGTTFSVTFTARSVHRAWPTDRLRRNAGTYSAFGFVPLQFTVSYVDDQGNEQAVLVPESPGKQPGPVGPGLVGYSARVPGCSRGCAIDKVSVQGSTHDDPILVTGMSLGDQRLLPAGDLGLVSSRHSSRLRTEASNRGLQVWIIDPYAPHVLLTWKRDLEMPVLVTPGLHLENSGGRPQAYGPDGEARPVRIMGQVPALPLLGRAGLLLDLGTALRGAGGQYPFTKSLVVARADTPASVLQRLTATGAVGMRVTVGQTLNDIRDSGTAPGTQLYALVAVFGLLVAGVSVVSCTAEQRRERRREAAALRVVCVDADDIARGYRGEAGVLGAAVTLVAGVAVWIACGALLGVLPLVQPGRFGLPFDATPQLGLVAGLAVAAGTFVTLVVFLALRLVGRSSPPSTLRSADR